MMVVTLVATPQNTLEMTTTYNGKSEKHTHALSAACALIRSNADQITIRSPYDTRITELLDFILCQRRSQRATVYVQLVGSAFTPLIDQMDAHAALCAREFAQLTSTSFVKHKL